MKLIDKYIIEETGNSGCWDVARAARDAAWTALDAAMDARDAALAAWSAAIDAGDSAALAAAWAAARDARA